eukprot:2847770-Prymnesium_polylepis.1
MTDLAAQGAFGHALLLDAFHLSDPRLGARRPFDRVHHSFSQQMLEWSLTMHVMQLAGRLNGR